MTNDDKTKIKERWKKERKKDEKRKMMQKIYNKKIIW